MARTLYAAGCLWNTFVVVAGVTALGSLVRYAAPALWEAFSAIRHSIGSRNERPALATLYRDLPASSFSEQILGRCPANLAVLPVHDVAWSDWGRPERVLATFASLGVSPAWAALTA